MHPRALAWLAAVDAGWAVCGAALPKAGAPLPQAEHVLAVQTFLDRSHFSPGEIHGRGRPNTAKAVAAFAKARQVTVEAAMAKDGTPATIAALFWDADPSHAKAMAAGPNDPVGTVWIDLTRPHYGIHGSAEPSTIGRTASHGCVRLTNWDAAAVAGLVTKSTTVVFSE